MTEAEWLASTNAIELVTAPIARYEERKLRLFACGCCRLVWRLLLDARSRKAVRSIEDYADALQDDRLRRDAYNIANAAYYASARSSDPAERHSAACLVLGSAGPGNALQLNFLQTSDSRFGQCAGVMTRQH